MHSSSQSFRIYMFESYLPYSLLCVSSPVWVMQVNHRSMWQLEDKAEQWANPSSHLSSLPVVLFTCMHCLAWHHGKLHPHLSKVCLMSEPHRSILYLPGSQASSALMKASEKLVKGQKKREARQSELIAAVLLWMVPEAAFKIQFQAKIQKGNSQTNITKAQGGHAAPTHLCYSNNHHIEMMLLPEKWQFQQKHLLPMSRLSNIHGAYQENVFEAQVWELKSLRSLLDLPQCSCRTLSTLLNIAKLVCHHQLNKHTKRW